ncbi:MAG: hypothetical protein HY895_10635 [Deltaproteobacteria bacterium]|nr:hypothetical protein [Deltaproteobacteria bacterium]
MITNMLIMSIPTSILPITNITAMDTIIRMRVNTITSILMGTNTGLNHLITAMSTLATEQRLMIVHSKQLIGSTGGLPPRGYAPAL